MLLNSVSHIVCKFQKSWMKKNAKFGDGPLKRLHPSTASLSSASGRQMSSAGAGLRRSNLWAVFQDYVLIIDFIFLREDWYHLRMISCYIFRICYLNSLIRLTSLAGIVKENSPHVISRCVSWRHSTDTSKWFWNMKAHSNVLLMIGDTEKVLTSQRCGEIWRCRDGMLRGCVGVDDSIVRRAMKGETAKQSTGQSEEWRVTNRVKAHRRNGVKKCVVYYSIFRPHAYCQLNPFKELLQFRCRQVKLL